VFWDQLRGVEEDGDSALVHLDTMSLNHLNALLDESRTGVLVGAAVASDSRDNPWLPRRGFLAEVEAGRFFSLDGSGLQYNRVVGQLYGFAPAGPVVLFGRAVAASVRAADGEMLPFYYLPILDKDLLTGFPSNRLFARDVLALSAGLRAPLAQVRGFYRIDGLLLGSLANAYDDLPDQFTPRVSFEEDVVVDEDGNVPLRPAAAVGLGLVNVRQHRMRFSFLMGFSPEGSLFSSYRVAFDLRDADALFR
ncbi:MAG TPA: hypothetical protein VD962_05765, partial [Rubricoccaceae bacterium]|nr:hypothetical protein [Rubricoccaceae bacterium]